MNTNPTDMPPVILASGSAYRKELLSRFGLPFSAVSPDVDETPLPAESPEQTALRLSVLKAKTVASANPQAIVIGSDQVCECDGQKIGKPGSFDNAFRQLCLLRGKTSRFHTGLAVVAPDGSVQSALVTTTVTFRNVSDDEISAYLEAEKPFDCAGSAKNEALGIILLEKIESTDPTALTGLPLIELTTMLRNLNVNFFAKR